MHAERFAIEERLQDLLESHPEILWLGELSESPPVLVPIGREVSVPSGSIDLLSLGSDGVLTLVETKLRRNEEARRTVVAQVLEYASYVATWDVDQIADTIRRYHGGKGTAVGDIDEWLSTTFDTPVDANLLDIIASTLADGQLRLVIALDAIPDSLRSLVSFVNRNSKFQLLLLQVTSYPIGNTQQVVVPDLFGYAPATAANARPTSSRSWTLDRDAFLAATGGDTTATATVAFLYDLAQQWTIRPGTGEKPGFFADVRIGRKRVPLYNVDPSHHQVWFTPSIADSLLDDDEPTSFAGQLRATFGQALRVGGKAYYYWVTMRDVELHKDAFVAVVEDVAARLRSLAAPAEIES